MLEPAIQRTQVLQLFVQRLRSCCSASLARDHLMQSVVARSQLSRDSFETWLQAVIESKREQTIAAVQSASRDAAAQASNQAAQLQLADQKVLELNSELDAMTRLVAAQRDVVIRDTVAKQCAEKALEDLKVESEAAMRNVAGELSAAKDDLEQALRQVHSLREEKVKHAAEAASQMKSLRADAEARAHEVAALKGDRDAVRKQLHDAERESRVLEEQLVSKSGHLILIEKELQDALAMIEKEKQDAQQQLHDLRADKERVVKRCQEMESAEGGQSQLHAEELADLKVSSTFWSVHLRHTFCSISCR